MNLNRIIVSAAKALASGILCLPITVAAHAQHISEETCRDIEKSVLLPIKPVIVNRNIVFSTWCDFEFSPNDSNSVSLVVQKHQTVRDARTALKSDLGSFTAANVAKPGMYRRVGLDNKGQWDQVFFYTSNYRDNFILLRKGRYRATIISTDNAVLRSVEENLRKVAFESRKSADGRH